MVVIHHYLLEYFPNLEGRIQPDSPTALSRTPFFALINGTAAVAVFFVLSGFVLTVRAFETRQITHLIMGAIKRYPRLAVPVLVANAISAFFLAAGLYKHQDRAWLDPQTYSNTASIFIASAKEALLGTFIHGSASFNAVIWTMRYELFGSFLVFALAVAILLTGKRVIGIFAIAVMIGMFGPDTGAWLSMMLVGTMVASYTAEFKPVWSNRISVTAMLLAVVLCGYDGLAPPRGFYSWLSYFEGPAIERTMHCVGATLILCTALYCPAVSRILSTRLGELLGKLSFPIYLVHLAVLNGVIYFSPSQIRFPLLLILTLCFAWPFLIFDRWWMQLLSTASKATSSIFRRFWEIALSDGEDVQRHDYRRVERNELRKSDR